MHKKKDGEMIKYTIVMLNDSKDKQQVYLISDEKVLNAKYKVLYYGRGQYHVANVMFIDLKEQIAHLTADLYLNIVKVNLTNCLKIVYCTDRTANEPFMKEEEIFKLYDKYENK